MINVLYIADVIGSDGSEIASACVPEFLKKYEIHLAIVNGENSASGKGLTARIAQSFFDMGIDVITSGNHIWDKNKIFPMLNENPRILRPLNYPPGCPGHGSVVVQTPGNDSVGIINLQGRSFMYPIDCPFRTIDGEIRRLANEGIKTLIIDFHAEASAEKMALGWFLDGRVSAVIGSHTHVQTADECVLPQGTAYITDAGMTGPFDSVIGMDKEIAIKRFISQLPVHYKVAHGDPKFCGVIIKIDKQSGRAESISRFQISHDCESGGEAI